MISNDMIESPEFHKYPTRKEYGCWFWGIQTGTKNGVGNRPSCQVVKMSSAVVVTISCESSVVSCCVVSHQKLSGVISLSHAIHQNLPDFGN